MKNTNKIKIRQNKYETIIKNEQYLNDIIKYETTFKSETQFKYEIFKIRNIILRKI